MVTLQKKDATHGWQVWFPCNRKKVTTYGWRVSYSCKKKGTTHRWQVWFLCNKKRYNSRVTGMVPLQKKGYNSRVTGMVPVQQKKAQLTDYRYSSRATEKRVQLTGDRYGTLAKKGTTHGWQVWYPCKKEYNSRVTGVVPVHKNEGEYWNSLFILEKIYNSV